MRRFWLLASFCAALVVATALSYRRAAATLCELPENTELFQVRFGPQQLPDRGWRLAWILSSGPRQVPGHIGFQLFVSPTGRPNRRQSTMLCPSRTLQQDAPPAALSSVAIWKEKASVCGNCSPPLRPMQGIRRL